MNAAIADKDRAVRYGSAEVSVGANGPATVTVKLSGKAAAATTKPTPESVPVGTGVTLEIESSLRGSAVLAVVRRGANVRTTPDADSEVILSQIAIAGNRVPQMLLTGKAGKYDIIAMLCAPRIPLARWPIAATAARVAIAAPDRAAAGSALRATISGALNAAYRVRFGELESALSETERLSDGERQDVTFKLPYEPGKYAITVTTHDDVVLARRPVTVEAAQFVITGPDKINLGAVPTFDWPNKGDADIRLEVWSLARNGKPARRISVVAEKRVIAPPGAHELRLVHSGATEKPVIARKPLHIEGRAFEQVPAEVPAGARVSVRMAIDVEFFDHLYFFRRGSDFDRELSLNHSRDPRVITADAPRKPGSYDLVFLMGTVGMQRRGGPRPGRGSGAITCLTTNQGRRRSMILIRSCALLLSSASRSAPQLPQ